MNLTLSEQERTAIRWTLLALPVIALAVVGFIAAEIASAFFSILVMFFLAWLLAFLIDPVVTRIEARLPFLPRGVAASLVFVITLVVAIALLALIASSAIRSLTSIIGTAPTVTDAIAKLVTPLQEELKSLGLDINVTAAATDLVAQVQANASSLLSTVISSGLTLFTQGSAIIFIAVVFVASKRSFLHYLQRLVPPSQTGIADAFVSAVGHSFGGFIRGNFGMAGLFGLNALVVAIIFGVPFAALILVVTVLLQSIPYFGQLVSWIPLVLTAFIFTPDVFVPVVIVYVVVLLILQNVVSPKVMGNAVGLNPVLVLAAVFIGAQVAGGIGAIFGVPVLAVFASLFQAWLDRVRPEEAVPADGGATSVADSAAGITPAADTAAAEPGLPVGPEAARVDTSRLAGTGSEG